VLALVPERKLEKNNVDKEVLEKVIKAISSLQFGEVIIKMQGGKVIWVDKYERERIG